MKRSEMIEKINDIVMYLTLSGMTSEIAESVLKIMEDAGMKPPQRWVRFKEPGKLDILEYSWEPESEE